jgi:pimeloyl-ACP methyl ester carboxylesterase
MQPTAYPSGSAAAHSVWVHTWDAVLDGDLVVPPKAQGVVLFAHGSGSSRHSPRNRFVASVLQQAGLGTLLLDLLTPEEEAIDERTAELRFDVNFLADRLGGATEWLSKEPATVQLPLGLFGASTGAAAALITAAKRPQQVRALVSRGGRPDLADWLLPQVQAPTLLIVGSRDEPVVAFNEKALQHIAATVKQLTLVKGATHLFEEPGALDEVARLARDWFSRHLVAGGH